MVMISSRLDAMAGSSFKVCKDQTYALCAAARCNVFDGVAYCQCKVKHGDSISLPFPMGKGEDVCSINAAGAAAPSMAQEGFSEDLGIIRACAGDIWSLCSDVLPDVGRIKSCVQNKMGQLSKGCLDKLLDAMAGAQFKVCKNQTYALCAAARCNVFDGVSYCQCDVKHGDSISLPFPMGKDEDVLLGQRRRYRQ